MMGSRKITETLAGENLEGLQPRTLNWGGGLIASTVQPGSEVKRGLNEKGCFTMGVS